MRITLALATLIQLAPCADASAQADVYDPGPLVPLAFDSTQPGLELHHVIGARQGVHAHVTPTGTAVHTFTLYDTRLICSAPCRIRVPAGSYRLALARPGARPIVARADTPLFRPTRMQGTVDDRSPIRAVGGALAVIGSVLGLGTAATFLALGFAEVGLAEEAIVTGAIVGAAVFMISLVTGISLASTSDAAHMSVRAM